MKLIFLITTLAMSIACNTNPSGKEQSANSQTNPNDAPGSTVDSANLTTVQWLDPEQNFGKITDGEKVLITFHFKNTGTKPLIITSVQASCGCTVPDKPEEPIAPGQEGQIKAEFNSEGRTGIAHKTLTVVCNTKEQPYTLNFNGEVLPKNKKQ